MKKPYFILFVVTTSLLINCRLTSDDRLTVGATKENGGRSYECNFSDGRRDKWNRALELASPDKKLRLACKEDFTISADSFSDGYQKIDIEQFTGCPITSGDFDNDGIAGDLAAILISINSEDSMRIVIINEVKRSDGSSGLDLAYPVSPVDLSRSVLSYSRAGLSLRHYGADGKTTYCRVEGKSVDCHEMNVDGSR